MNNVILYHPETIEALRLALKDANTQTAIIAGGTDVVVKMRSNQCKIESIIDLSGLSGLKYIGNDGDTVKIGALTSLSIIERSEIIKTHFPALSMAASLVGSTQIRNLGTLPGNLCNASPCADTVPALMAYDAQIEIMNGEGDIKRVQPDKIIYGQGRNMLKPDEVILDVLIPKKKGLWYHGYSKIGSRKAVTIAKLNSCVLVKVENNKIIDARAYVGSLGRKAFRADLVEKAIIGACLDKELRNKMSLGFKNTVDASIMGRASYAYKYDAVKGLADNLADQLISQVEKEVCPDEKQIHREVLSTS